MGYDLQQNQTARPLLFIMIDSSDHISGKTGLTPTVTISKDGAAYASPLGTVSEIGNGMYKVAGNATDENTLGLLALHATAAGADPTDDIFRIVATALDIRTAVGLASANLDTQLAEIEGETDDIAAVKAKTDNLPGSPAAVGSAMTLTTGERNSIADALLDRTDGIETGLTPRGAFRLATAANAGKLSGAATTSVVIRNVGDTKARITATVDADGNRTAVTTDAT